MNYKLLGKSDLRISEIGFGCMSLKGDEKEISSLINQAIASGINFFDTADLYDKGENEKIVGRALREKRKDLILATKVGNQLREDGSGWDWNPRKEYILQAVDKSLQRLQTDYIDLYQLHGGTIDDPIDETIEAFEILKKLGKIRYYGISSIRPNVIREYVSRSNIVSVMMQYSLLDRRPEESCLDLLKQHEIGVLTRGSIAQGLLASKPAKEYLNYSKEEVEKVAAAIQSLSTGERNDVSTAMLFVLQHPAITSSVVGIRNQQQLTDAVMRVNKKPLSSVEIELLRNVIPANYYTVHR